MKSKYRFALMFMVSAFFMLLGCIDVSAATLVDAAVDDVYYTRRGGGQSYVSAQYKTYTMDGKTVYCIEPNVDITVHDYNGKVGWINSPYSDEINQKIQLYGYYGYDYPGHNTLRYRMAAQALIWEETGGQILEFWTEQYGYGDYINLDYERNEIKKLVAAHYNQPKFNENTKTGIINETITFTDTAGYLPDYVVHQSNGANVSISGNNLLVTPTKTGETNIILKKKMYTDNPTTIFVGTDIKSQKMGYFGVDDPLYVSVKVNALGGKIQLKKVDSETNSTTPQGSATLVGAKYNIINSNGSVVSTLTIGDDCTAISKYLPYGKYTIKEVSAPTGYYLTTNISEQFISEKKDYSITIKNDVIKNFISILKQYDYVNGNTTFLNAEANITFEIFYPNGTKYGEVKTDKNGYATLDIPYGVWKFHQVNSNTGFEKIYDFFITVDENSEKEQYYNILNNKISAYLQVVKRDSETGKTIAIANTKFKILNTDTNQYISQYVGGKVYDNFLTDENGTFTTYLKLEAGNYKLVEIESPTGYLISKDGLKFTIGENTEYNFTTYGAIVVVDFENTPIKGQVEIFKNGEKFVVEDGTFKYKDIKLKGIKFNIYADEDIKSADGNYLYYNKGDLVETISTNDDGYVKSKKLPLGKYYLVEVETNDKYVLDTTEYHFELTEKDNKTTIVYDTYKAYNYLKKGTLEFTKKDYSTSEPIPNVEFNIYTENYELIYSGKTDESGKITIKELAVGKYYIEEVSPIGGYVSSEEKVYFEIKDNGEIVKSEMTNKKITSTLKITKNDEDNNLLSEIKFGIYDLEDNLISEHITDDNGYFEVILEYGKYYLKEIATKDCYVLSDEKIYFEVKEEGAVIEKTISNSFKTGTLEFTKTDLVNGDVIPNTLIEIYDSQDQLVFSGKTDENGKVVVEELRYGKYYIIEKEAATGFVITDEKVYFEILENDKVVKAEMKNRPVYGNFELTKIDISTGEVIEGALIEIFDENDNLVYSGYTDKDGKIYVTELKYGKYKFKESMAPEGYILNDEIHEFEIRENGEIIKDILSNEKLIIDVPNTLSNDYKILIPISLCGFGIILILLSKERRKK